MAGAGPRRTHHSCHPGPPLREIVAPSPGTARRFDRTDPLYLRHDRPPQRCSDHQAEHRRGSRRTRRCVAVDRRRHSGAWPSAVPRPRVDPGGPGSPATGRATDPHRHPDRRHLRRCRRIRRDHVLRRADGVEPRRRRSDCGTDAVVGASPGVGQRPASRAGLRADPRAHRPRDRRALRHDRNTDHRQHARRRTAPARMGGTPARPRGDKAGGERQAATPRRRERGRSPRPRPDDGVRISQSAGCDCRILAPGRLFRDR